MRMKLAREVGGDKGLPKIVERAAHVERHLWQRSPSCTRKSEYIDFQRIIIKQDSVELAVDCARAWRQIERLTSEPISNLEVMKGLV